MQNFFRYILDAPPITKNLLHFFITFFYFSEENVEDNATFRYMSIDRSPGGIFYLLTLSKKYVKIKMRGGVIMDMQAELYLSNVVEDEDISKIQPGYFNILRAPRGWGKTTFMFDDRILALARAKKNILYLIHNTIMRDSIAAHNVEKATVFESADDVNQWFIHRDKKMWNFEPDEDKIHVMCYQTFAALLRKKGDSWLQDIDLIIWDEFDDVRTYYKKDIQMLKKALPTFSEERLAALLQEGKPTSVVNFVYQIKTKILDPKKITLLAISASPDRAALYFKEYINYILEGQLEEKYVARETYFINSVCGAIKDGTIHKGRRYWCFTSYIHDGFRIASLGEGYGLHCLVLWSERNEQWRHLLTDERKAALQCIAEERDLPEEYDMIIITAAGNRGINIYDTSFQDWICDSTEYEALMQYMRARFSPARQYLLNGAKGVVNFIQNNFAIDYYDWHSLDELRKMMIDMPILDKNGKVISSFNAVKKEYPDLFESRKYGRSRTTQYRIKPAE